MEKKTLQAWAQVEIDSSGTPVSTQFDDVYFSRTSGVDETIYVFIEGNNLHQRLLQQDVTFVVGETGFGTGLNALVLFEYLSKHNIVTPVHFVSTEKFPIEKNVLEMLLQPFKEHLRGIESFLEQYETLLAGGRIYLNECFSISVLLGDAATSLQAYPNKMDAWFLDGFSPSKNTEMWKSELFEAMASCSKQGTTFATFTAAKIVKDGLVAAGFSYEKRKGFAFKRHMLFGEISHEK